MSDSFSGLTSLEDSSDSRLLARLRETEAALAEARASVEAKTNLLATVSHEIRTPMGAVISMADLLMGTRLDGTQQYYADTLRHSANSLLSILNDILDHSKLEVGRFELSKSCFSPRSLLASLESTVQARAAEKNIQIVAEADPQIPEFVTGDADRIRQILMNLADNAVKFTEVGSVVINMTHREKEDGLLKLAFSIQDTGMGMSEEVKAKLFAPFTQADRTIANKYGGTGLGLSIARKLVDLMDGSIGCESLEGNGSTFWFTVSCERASAEEIAAADPAPSNQRRASDRAEAGQRPPAPRTATPAPTLSETKGSSSAHILVVEDNKINQMLITTYLDKFGYSFEIAANGLEAVAAAGKKVYDLILMDVQMPEMDGIEATRQIRALDGPVSKQPIVALTANAMHGDRENYLEAGMDDYLAKPIIAANLLDMLKRVLSSGNNHVQTG